jgi:hypothetical protein
LRPGSWAALRLGLNAGRWRPSRAWQVVNLLQLNFLQLNWLLGNLLSGMSAHWWR